MKFILAHDFGTSADKAALFTFDGELVAKRTAAYPSHHTGGGVEQDAHDWWRCFCENTKALLAKHDPKEVACVSFSGTAPNCLCVGKDMQPLGKAMIWQDVRAKAEAEKLSDILPEAFLKGHPGGKVSADRTLCKLLWIRRHCPEIYQHTWKVLPSVASYIIMRLTGRTVCDYGVARTTAMLAPDQSDWADEVLEAAELDRGMLPELVGRSTVIGTVSAYISEACGLAPGTPIVAGTVDYICTMIGAGVYGPGSFLLCGGTSASIDGYDLAGNRFGRATTASGGALNWLKDQLCPMEQLIARETGTDVFEVMNREIAQVPAGSNGVIFQPYLAGARSVFNDVDVKGSFTGITLSTTRADMMRSVVEGVGINLSLILDVIRDMGIPVTRMPIVGGLGNGAVVRQIFADIMNVQFVVYDAMNEAAAIGAAVLGGMAMGLYQDESAVQQFLRVTSITEPDPAAQRFYAQWKAQYKLVYRQLADCYHAQSSQVNTCETSREGVLDGERRE